MAISTSSSQGINPPWRTAPSILPPARIYRMPFSRQIRSISSSSSSSSARIRSIRPQYTSMGSRGTKGGPCSNHRKAFRKASFLSVWSSGSRFSEYTRENFPAFRARKTVRASSFGPATGVISRWEAASNKAAFISVRVQAKELIWYRFPRFPRMPASTMDTTASSE